MCNHKILPILNVIQLGKVAFNPHFEAVLGLVVINLQRIKIKLISR